MSWSVEIPELEARMSQDSGSEPLQELAHTIYQRTHRTGHSRKDGYKDADGTAPSSHADDGTWWEDSASIPIPTITTNQKTNRRGFGFVMSSLSRSLNNPLLLLAVQGQLEFQSRSATSIRCRP
jgi:hypothetical protein